jgi:hypothetical protein
MINAHLIKRLLVLFEAIAIGAFVFWAVLSIAIVIRCIDHLKHPGPWENDDLTGWNYLALAIILLPIYAGWVALELKKKKP